MKKVGLKVGIAVAVLGVVAFFVSETKAEKVTAETIQVCSYYHDSECQTSDSTVVYAPVSGRYDIVGLVERGTHSGNCQAHEDFSLYVNGSYVAISYDPDSCEENESTTYNENLGNTYLNQGVNSVAIYHAHSRDDYDSTGEAESVSVQLTFFRPDTVNGACGTSNGSTSESAPTTGLCSLGTTSAVSGSGPWSWTCYGLYGGSDATCEAEITPTNGVCGTASKTYLYSDTDWGTGATGCASGQQDPYVGFPGAGESVSWVCRGLNGGTDSATCVASRGETPVVPSCGDGNVDSGEYCDDGNTTNGDGCSSVCAVENAVPYCGDGNVDSGEYCDDGNTTDGDGCSSVCAVEETTEEPTEEPKEEPKEEAKEEAKGECEGSIGNYIWNDADMDGVQDSNEKGIENIRVKAVWDGGDGEFGNSNDEEFRTDTNHNGHYAFEGLCEGEYKITVKEEDIDGLKQTYDPDGKKDDKTKVEMEGDKDSTSKIDFGYAGKTVPVTGPGAVAAVLSLISSGIGAVAYRRFRK